MAKFGTSGNNPILFCLLQALSGIVLSIIAAVKTKGKDRPKKEHFWRFVAAGFALFLN